MKKFSNITGEKISKEPKVEIKINEEDVFKSRVMRLMDDFLKVQMYGPITRYHVAGTMKVSGKELFLEALMDLLSDKSNKDITKILESLKSEITDWKTIDEKIVNISSRKSTFIYRNKIKQLYNKYKSDSELLFENIDKSINKLNNKDSLISRIQACESLIEDVNYNKDIIQKISDKYKNRLSEISYNEN